MAAAPDLPTLLQFELQIETAAVAALTVPLAGLQIVRERSTAKLESPYIEVRLQMGAPTGKKRALAGAAFSPGQSIDEAYYFQLILSVVTNRKSDNNGSRHDELLGQLRAVAMPALGGLNGQLAWLTIQKLDSVGVVPMVQAMQDIDQSPCVFAGQFCIRPDAWPALPAAS